jgi:hypothetical protein
LPVVVVVSVDAVLFVDDEDCSLLVLLPVPLAPMLEVPLELLGAALLLVSVELLGVELVEPVAELVLGVVLFVVEALVPPPDEDEPVPEPELVCATAMPPMASAAAAANVVSVFFVVVMSIRSLKGKLPARGNMVETSRRVSWPTASKAIDGDGRKKWVYAGRACRTRTVTS